MKKLTALLLALIMVLAIGSATADGITSDNGILGNKDSTNAINSFTFDVTLKKKAGVNNPELIPTYVIAENDEVANPYKAGIPGGLYFGTDANKTTFQPNLTNTETTQKVTVSVDADLFDTAGPGVYRYKITETIPTDKVAIGFEALDATEKYIDVYVKKNGTSNIVYAVAMFNEIDATSKAPTTSKDGGFEIGYTHDDHDNDDTTSDEPVSYDVKILKTLSGSAQDPSETFKFTLDIAALPAAAGTIINVEKYEVPDAPATIELGTAVSKDLTFKGNSYIILKGVPKTLGITISEEIANDGGDYTTSLTPENMTTTGPVTGATTNVARTVSASVKELTGTETDIGLITVNNARDSISPTGVVLRVAPYAIMLGAGVVLFIILKSRKNKAVEEA